MNVATLLSLCRAIIFNIRNTVGDILDCQYGPHLPIQLAKHSMKGVIICSYMYIVICKLYSTVSHLRMF